MLQSWMHYVKIPLISTECPNFYSEVNLQHIVHILIMVPYMVLFKVAKWNKSLSKELKSEFQKWERETNSKQDRKQTKGIDKLCSWREQGIQPAVPKLMGHGQLLGMKIGPLPLSGSVMDVLMVKIGNPFPWFLHGNRQSATIPNWVIFSIVDAQGRGCRLPKDPQGKGKKNTWIPVAPRLLQWCCQDTQSCPRKYTLEVPNFK